MESLARAVTSHVQNIQIVGEESLKVSHNRDTAVWCVFESHVKFDAQRTPLTMQIFLNRFFHCSFHEVQEDFPLLSFHRQELSVFLSQISCYQDNSEQDPTFPIL